MKNSCAPLHSEQAEDTRENCFTCFTSVCTLACMWIIILCLCVELQAKMKFVEKLKQFSKKCLLFQDVCDVLYVCFVVLYVELF